MAKYKLLGTDVVSGQLKHPESIALNVMDYGAFNDGTNATATTAAIQAAIDDCVTATGQKVYLPAGTYLVNSTLNLLGGVTFYGDGMEKTIIYSTTNQVIINLIEGNTPYDYIGPSLSDLQIRGSKTAGTNQIGIKCEPGGDYMFDVVLENIKILTCGFHGLHIKKTFSSRFVNIFSSDHAGYPFFFDVQNMPGNHYEGLYAGDVNSTYPAGFRIYTGSVTLKSCNGIHASSSNSYWAIVGQLASGGFDSAGSNIAAGLFLENCNIESSRAGGILSYTSSPISLHGDTAFGGDGASFGVYKALNFVGVDTPNYPPHLTKAVIGDKVTFANSYKADMVGTVALNSTVNVVGTGTDFLTTQVVGGLIDVPVSGVSYIRKIATITDDTHLSVTSAFPVTSSGKTLQRLYYAEGCAIHADDLPPVITIGESPKLVQGPRQNFYYNTTNSRLEALTRADGRFPVVEVTSTTSTFTNPGSKYYEVTMASDGTLTLPWPGWCLTPEPIIIKNLSATGVIVTIAAASAGTVNTSGLTLTYQGDSVTLLPNPVALDYRVIDRYTTAPSGGSGISWSETTGTSQTMAVDTAYIANNASLVTYTLPTTAAVGKVFKVSGKGAGGWRLGQASSQIINFGNLSTTTGTGGRLDSTHRRDAVELVCVTANTEFNVISSIGNITVT